MVAMREIDVTDIENAVAELCQEANYTLPDDVMEAYHEGLEKEESSLGKEIFGMLLENARIASSERVPLCQDTGLAVIFAKIGQDVKLTGGDLKTAINRGVAKGYTEGYLRKSVVSNPLDRVNTGDNTPAMIHLDIVPGDKVKLICAPKGGGSENMSALKMLKPSDGLDGVRTFVVETVRNAGPNPCPPIVVGIGIGGSFEKAAILAKKSLIRPIGSRHPEEFFSRLEEELLSDINREGIGPMGLGGRMTALDVHIEYFPCHIASLPVAININCHSSRHREIVL